MNPAFNMHQR